MIRISRFVAALAFLAVVASPAVGRAASTLDNLQQAYDGESNAMARYAAFAQRADAEGYAAVANLFRAASRAEGVHLANHAAVIRRMGGVPAANVKPPVVGTTSENLDTARKGEVYERDVMYPAFMKQARAEGNTRALRTLHFAHAAENEHAQLYASALSGLEKWKGPRAGFWVCPECGSTVAESPARKCRVCYTAPGKYVHVS